MSFDEINAKGLVLLGCGKMGSAILEGWLNRGMTPGAVHVHDPYPSDWLKTSGVRLNETPPETPRALMIAVKPQMMDEALPKAAELVGPGTLVLTVAAGTGLARYEAAFSPDQPIVRTMPNTPAAVGKGITALIGNAAAGESDLALAGLLMSAVGQVVQLEVETQMDAVTAVSGSGPAYVFHMIECLAAAGRAEGLSEDLAMTLAKATVAGAGALAMEADEDPAQLRVNVTSPKGTTEAALGILMDKADGLPPLMRRAVRAAAERSRELGK